MTRGMDHIMGRLAHQGSTLSTVDPDGQTRHPQHVHGTMAPAKRPKSAQICHDGDDHGGPAGSFTIATCALELWAFPMIH